MEKPAWRSLQEENMRSWKIDGTRGSRLTMQQQLERNMEFRGRPLAQECCPQGGRRLLRANEAIEKTPDQIADLAQDVHALRTRASEIILSRLGITMIKTPKGNFTFQGVKGVPCDGFWMAQTPLTNGQFDRLIELRGDDLALIMADPKRTLEQSLRVAADPSEAENCPLVLVSWIESVKISGLLGGRLPAELEWERAAAGIKGNTYPFGARFDRNRVAFDEKGTRSVFAHKNGKSPEGFLDLSGNVWEPTSSAWGKIYLSFPPNPVFPKHGGNFYRVTRGGSWADSESDSLQATSRNKIPWGIQCENLGIRLARDIGQYH